MRDLNESGIKSSDAIDNDEKAIATLGHRPPQTAEQNGDRKYEGFHVNIYKRRNEHLNVGGVFSRSTVVTVLERDAWLVVKRLS